LFDQGFQLRLKQISNPVRSLRSCRTSDIRAQQLGACELQVELCGFKQGYLVSIQPLFVSGDSVVLKESNRLGSMLLLRNSIRKGLIKPSP